MAASASEGSSQQQLAESVKRFSRSIELCDDYLRGYYGLKLVRAINASYGPTVGTDMLFRSRTNLSRNRQSRRDNQTRRTGPFLTSVRYRSSTS